MPSCFLSTGGLEERLVRRGGSSSSSSSSLAFSSDGASSAEDLLTRDVRRGASRDRLSAVFAPVELNDRALRVWGSSSDDSSAFCTAAPSDSVAAAELLERRDAGVDLTCAEEPFLGVRTAARNSARFSCSACSSSLTRLTFDPRASGISGAKLLRLPRELIFLLCLRRYTDRGPPSVLSRVKSQQAQPSGPEVVLKFINNADTFQRWNIIIFPARLFITMPVSVSNHPVKWPVVIDTVC